MSNKTKRTKFFATSVMCLYSQAPCKRRYYYFWPTTPNIFVYYMLRLFVHPAAICCVLLRAFAQSLKPVKLLTHQLPTLLLFCDRRSEARKCSIRFAQFFLPCWSHTRASHVVYLDLTKSYGLYSSSSHDALERPTLLEMKEI